MNVKLLVFFVYIKIIIYRTNHPDNMEYLGEGYPGIIVTIESDTNPV